MSNRKPIGIIAIQSRNSSKKIICTPIKNTKNQKATCT